MEKIKTGIWLDFQDAYIITIGGGEDGMLHHIKSDIDTSVAKGGSRTATPWGPQGEISEKHFLERRKQSENVYFRHVIDRINPKTMDLVVFGPAEAKYGLRKELKADRKWNPLVHAVLPADYMTHPQMVALMRHFFEEPKHFLAKVDEEEMV